MSTAHIERHPDAILDAAYVVIHRAVEVPEARFAAEASLRTYRATGLDAAVKLLGDLVPTPDPFAQVPTVVCAARRSLELFAGEDTDLDSLARLVGYLADEDWSVFLLVPLPKVGEAQAACHGSGVGHVQGYWLHTGKVAFGHPHQT
jgi:hypothetical protein